VHRKGGKVELAVMGKLDPKAVQVILCGIRTGTVSGGTASADEKGLLVRLFQDRATVIL